MLVRMAFAFAKTAYQQMTDLERIELISSRTADFWSKAHGWAPKEAANLLGGELLFDVLVVTDHNNAVSVIAEQTAYRCILLFLNVLVVNRTIAEDTSVLAVIIEVRNGIDLGKRLLRLVWQI